MNSGPTIPADANEAIYATGADPEGDLPIYCAHRRPSGIPEFIDRTLTRMQTEPFEGDFTFEDVEFTIAGGVWLAPVGVYQIEEETPSTAEEIALGASPTGPYGNVMLEWATGVRQAMNDAWGEPAQSDLRQIVMLLPRKFIMNGMSALIGDEGSAHELLMHGEHLLELRRRVWILSAAFGHGEVRLRDAPIEATRCSLQAVNGTNTVSMFADDGRALVLVQDPESEFAQTAAAQFMAEQLGDEEPSDEALAEARLILSERLLDGIPSDLRACIAVRGETMRGDMAEHELEFGILGDQAIPVISGAFWCDGETWHTTDGLMTIGKRNGFGMDDFGVATALRRPYRLGGEFTVDLFTSQDNVERREQLEQIFAACPYPEQPRPEGDARLGYSIPSDTTRGEIVDDIERVTAAWWDQSPADAKLGDDTFRVAHRSAARSDDPDLLNFVLAQSTHWTVDALQEWNSNLISVMSERWGDRRDVGVEDANGDERRTPPQQGHARNGAASWFTLVGERTRRSAPRGDARSELQPRTSGGARDRPGRCADRTVRSYEYLGCASSYASRAKSRRDRGCTRGRNASRHRAADRLGWPGPAGIGDCASGDARWRPCWELLLGLVLHT